MIKQDLRRRVSSPASSLHHEKSSSSPAPSARSSSGGKARTCLKWSMLCLLVGVPLVAFAGFGLHQYYDNCDDCCWIWQLWWYNGLQSVDECERVATITKLDVISSGGYRTVWKATMPYYAFNKTMWRRYRLGTHQPSEEDRRPVDVVYKPLTEPNACGKRMAHFREVILESELDHENIAPFIASCGIDSYGPISTVNMFIRGGTVKHAMRNGFRPLADVRLQLMLDVSRAIEYLHHHPSGVIVHDDLNWDQVLLNEARTRATLTDFNLAARLSPAGGTKQRSWWPAGGTWKFFAPEKLRMEPYNSSVDVYSLGIIYYQLLQPREKFTGISKSFYKRNILNKEEGGWRPERPKEALDWEWDLIEWCWRYRQGDRPCIRDVVKVLEGHV